MKGQEWNKRIRNWAYIACVLLVCAGVTLAVPRLLPPSRNEAVEQALAELYRRGQAAPRVTSQQVVARLEEDAGLLLEERSGSTQTTAEYAIVNDWAGLSDSVSFALQDGGVIRVDIRLRRRYPRLSAEEETQADWGNKRSIFAAALAAFDVAGQLDEAALARFLALLDQCMEQETAACDTQGNIHVQLTPAPMVGALEHTILITIKEA